VVVNAAIALLTEVEVAVGGGSIRLTAEDLGETVELENVAQLLDDGVLPLHKAGLRMFPVPGCTLVTRSSVPPGSGLGSSGSLDVALVAALTTARKEMLEPVEIAEAAWHLETVEARIPGGKQDQFAAALGGFNLLRFQDPEVECRTLQLDPEFAAALERQLVLCHTGTSRVSGDMIARVMEAYERGDAKVTGALYGIKETALAMAEALQDADLARMGALLGQNWRYQQELDPAMCTSEMERLEWAMARAGVLGGKAAGAGAGGAMFFLARDAPGKAIAAMREVGATFLPVQWSLDGVRAW
jgi:D-glycero-alpha-D-manno-heptose-7-phosphate kinase